MLEKEQVCSCVSHTLGQPQGVTKILTVLESLRKLERRKGSAQVSRSPPVALTKVLLCCLSQIFGSALGLCKGGEAGGTRGAQGQREKTWEV